MTPLATLWQAFRETVWLFIAAPAEMLAVVFLQVIGDHEGAQHRLANAKKKAEK